MRAKPSPARNLRKRLKSFNFKKSIKKAAFQGHKKEKIVFFVGLKQKAYTKKALHLWNETFIIRLLSGKEWYVVENSVENVEKFSHRLFFALDAGLF